MLEFYPYITNDGSVGLFSPNDDDVYHSTYGALTESWQKFILPSHLMQYVMSHDEMKILDICYGIGYNTKTALQVLIENSLEKEKKYKKRNNFFKILNNNTKNCSTKTEDYCAIHTDNIVEDEKTKNEKENIKKRTYDQKKKEDGQLSIAPIDGDNIYTCEHGTNDLGKDENSVKREYFNHVLIDAVDTDKNLMNLSPFVATGIKATSPPQKTCPNKKDKDNKINDKIYQVQKLMNLKIKLPPKKYRLKNEVSIIILDKLLEQNSDFFNEVILQTILSQKKYFPFFNQYMVNFATFYQNLVCKHNQKVNKWTFLHNIYYRYVSKSYKKAKKVLKDNKFSMNFYSNDARGFIKQTKNRYNFIFLDAFTPAKCPALWSLDFFNELYSKLEDDGMILTYSSSAAVRNAMIKNGFSVGKIYDNNLKKSIGTVATKNPSLIEHPLDDLDLELINSRAGICFRDKDLCSDNTAIIENREIEVEHSPLISSSKVLKGYRNDNLNTL